MLQDGIRGVVPARERVYSGRHFESSGAKNPASCPTVAQCLNRRCSRAGPFCSRQINSGDAGIGMDLEAFLIVWRIISLSAQKLLGRYCITLLAVDFAISEP